MVDKRTSRLIVRTTPEELGDWEVQAKAEGVTLADLVRARMSRRAKRGLRSDAVPALHRQIEELTATGDAMHKAIEAKNAEIDKLTKQLKPVAGLKLSVLTEAPKRETYLRGQAPEKGKTKR
jgi:hypothetical protein